MAARPPLVPPSARLRLLMEAHGHTAATLGAAAGLAPARIGAALNGATTDPHSIAARLGLAVGVVLAVRANPAGPHTLPLRVVQAILDGAPPTPAELAALAAVFGLEGADALNDRCCPRCHAVGGIVGPILCHACGWRIVFPRRPTPEAA